MLVGVTCDYNEAPTTLPSFIILERCLLQYSAMSSGAPAEFLKLNPFSDRKRLSSTFPQLTRDACDSFDNLLLCVHSCLSCLHSALSPELHSDYIHAALLPPKLKHLCLSPCNPIGSDWHRLHDNLSYSPLCRCLVKTIRVEG